MTLIETCIPCYLRHTDFQKRYSIFKQLRNAINPDKDYCLIEVTYNFERTIDAWVEELNVYESDGFEVIQLIQKYDRSESDKLLYIMNPETKFFVLCKSKEDENLFRLMYKVNPIDVFYFSKKERQRFLERLVN